MQSGASSYITKDTAGEKLVVAIRKVHGGDKQVTRTLAEQLASYLQRDAAKPLHKSLSDHEFQILHLLGAGKTTNEVGEQLALSGSTIKAYRQRILDKLNLRSTAAVIHYAVKSDLVD